MIDRTNKHERRKKAKWYWHKIHMLSKAYGASKETSTASFEAMAFDNFKTWFSWWKNDFRL